MAKIYTIHEVRYFYLGLAALGRRDGSVSDDRVDAVIRDELNHFNSLRNRKYNLREREFSFQQTPRWILYELREYGLVTVRGRGAEKQWALTAEGQRFYEMLKNPANRLRLREEFAVLMLNTFPVFREFLTTLASSPHNGIAGVPLLSRYDFDHFSAAEHAATVERAISLTDDLLRSRFRMDDSLLDALREALSTAMAAQAAEGKTLGLIIENEVHRFFIHHFFGNLLTSKTRYDLVRNRSSFLGLVNYFREGRRGASVEIIYPVARLSDHEMNESGWHCLPLQTGYLLLRAPMWNDFAPTFLDSLQRACSAVRRSIGYAEIADVRDRICFELRLPDHIFDEFLQQAVQAGRNGELPVRVYLDSSLGDTMPLPKRAPLELKERAFNLVRVQTVEGGTESWLASLSAKSL